MRRTMKALQCRRSAVRIGSYRRDASERSCERDATTALREHELATKRLIPSSGEW